MEYSPDRPGKLRFSERGEMGMKHTLAPRSRVVQFFVLMIRRYERHNVGIQSAALAFYLLFTLFPFLIFISALLGLLRLHVAELLPLLQELLPAEVLALIEMYLTYVSEHPSLRLLLFGLVFSVYFPMRATNTLLRSVRTAYRLGPPEAALTHWLRVLFYTAALMMTIALTLTLMTFGERALWYAVERFHLPALAAVLWVRLRFPAAAAVGFFALLLLYALAQDTRQPFRNIWPGALFALTAWMALSWLYACYADRFAHYSTLYGSLGAVIVVLIWLELSAVVLILGAEVNGSLISMRKDAQYMDTAP